MKLSSFIAFVLFAVACGNPHLTKPAPSAVPEQFPLDGAELRALSLGPTDGDRKLEVSTNGTSTSVPVHALNPNPDVPLVVSYHFESGAHFRFRGGTFPGTAGDCVAEHVPAASCALDIEFHATESGVYADNLIATYHPKNKPLDQRRVLLPLRGEKIAPPGLSPDVLSARSLGGQSSLDYGRDLVDRPRQDTVVVRNESDRPLQVAVRLAGAVPFAQQNDCPAVLAAGATCQVQVTYTPTAPGTHQDSVIVSYWGENEAAAREVRVPVIGEAYAPTNPCGDVPCGEEPRPGQLRLSAIHADGIDFGSVTLGGEARKQIEITNIGDLPVVLNGMQLSGGIFTFAGGAYPGSNGTCGETVLPGSCVLDLVFKPTAVGAQSAALSLVPASASVLSITLMGQGEAPAQVCEAVEETVITARPSANAAGIVFPYLASAPGTSARLSYLYGTSTNSYIRAINRYTVKDAQVFVVFDIPRLEGEVIETKLSVDVLKVIADGHRDTESLCLSSGPLRRCSGQEFTLASWQRLKNPVFWQPLATPVNGLYEDEFARGESRCGSYNCMALRTEYNVRDLFALGRREMQELKGSMSAFIFSDDTRLVSMPRLVIKTRKRVSCR